MRPTPLAMAVLALLALAPPPAARADCAAVERALARRVIDFRCVESADLTTRNADTTPADNSRVGLPPSAFTPRTDAQAVSPDAPARTAIDPHYPLDQLSPLSASDTRHYDYLARRKPYHLSPRIGQISTDGAIALPLITVHGTMDALLPIQRHARPFRDAVVAAGRANLHRLYEIQNGNHIERYRQSCCNFTQLEFLQPHAHRAFELLVDWVERGTPPPASQCVPRGGTIVANPAAAQRPERCARLLAE